MIPFACDPNRVCCYSCDVLRALCSCFVTDLCQLSMYFFKHVWFIKNIKCLDLENESSFAVVWSCSYKRIKCGESLKAILKYYIVIELAMLPYCNCSSVATLQVHL